MIKRTAIQNYIGKTKKASLVKDVQCLIFVFPVRAILTCTIKIDSDQLRK